MSTMNTHTNINVLSVRRFYDTNYDIILIKIVIKKSKCNHGIEMSNCDTDTISRIFLSPHFILANFAITSEVSDGG